MISCVFVGPTLSAREVEAELAAVCLPPVSQGDVYRLARLGPRAIGIIDGYFDRVPAVWHKEILWALTRGIHVYGSASMGALRAAELEPFGMVGVGPIFEAYRDGTLEDDDEVAVGHATADHGYRCLSDAMVNIRSTLARAEAAGVLRPTSRAALEAIAKALFYAERSYPLILERAAGLGLAAGELDALRSWLPTGQVNQKREDALAMLRLMRQQLTDSPEPKRVTFHMEHTTWWDRAMRLAGTSDLPLHGIGTMTTTNALLDELRLKGAGYRQVLERWQRRDLALADSRQQGWQPDSGAVHAKTREFGQMHGLHQPEELDRWLQVNDLTRAQFDALMREEAIVERVFSGREIPSQMLDLLRIDGLYSTLQSRARDKQRKLEAAGLQSPSLEAVGLTSEEVLRWYFETLGCPVPSDRKRYAKSHGFESTDTFLLAVLREYCYLQLSGGDA